MSNRHRKQSISNNSCSALHLCPSNLPFPLHCPSGSVNGNNRCLFAQSSSNPLSHPHSTCQQSLYLRNTLGSCPFLTLVSHSVMLVHVIVTPGLLASLPACPLPPQLVYCVIPVVYFNMPCHGAMLCPPSIQCSPAAPSLVQSDIHTCVYVCLCVCIHIKLPTKPRVICPHLPCRTHCIPLLPVSHSAPVFQPQWPP